MNDNSLKAAIIFEIGDHFDKEKRESFAQDLLESLATFLPRAVRQEAQWANLAELRDRIGDASAIVDLAVAAERAVGPSVRSLVSAEAFVHFKRTGNELCLKMVQAYLSDIRAALHRVAVPATKRGPKTAAHLLICKMAAAKYLLHFRKCPGVTRNADGDGTPFIRLCTVLEAVLGHGPISNATIEAAVGSVRPVFVAWDSSGLDIDDFVTEFLSKIRQTPHLS